MPKKKPLLQPQSDGTISATPDLTTTVASTTPNPPKPPRICLNCRLSVRDMTNSQFQYHVAECHGTLGLDIAGSDNATSVSTLSPPPLSPSHQTQSSVRDASQDVKQALTDGDQIVVAGLEEALSNFAEKYMDPIRPYVNPATEFEYYEPSVTGDNTEVEPQTSNPLKTSGIDDSPAPSLELESGEGRAEISETTETSSSAPSIELLAKSEIGPKSVPSQKYKFAKLSNPDIFETYLENPEDMTYEELYERTAKISVCLVAWQKEWDDIQKDIYAYETVQKAEKSRAEDKAKAEAEALRLLDDQARDRVRDKYKFQLSLKGQEWADFLEEVEKVDIDPVETLRHLSNLKNPQFMAQVNKKRRPTRHKEVRFENMPLPESKPTKDEINSEKRKRGRLIDAVRFDDMKQADVYGFEYSAHNKHHGAQPLGADSSRTAQKKKKSQIASGADPANSEVDANGSGRTRAPRNKTKRAYGEGDADGTPESEEESLAGRRTKKPKYLQDGNESTGGSRPQSRGGTPSVKTFASGKRVGRPPAKSKLQAVQMAPKSPTPGQGNSSQDLAPMQKAQLLEAAESLVNQTVSDKAEEVPVKKHAGGRPKKSTLANKAAVMDITEPPVSVPKPKNKGGRPKKNQSQGGIQSSVKAETASYDSAVQLGEENGVLQSTEQNDGSQDHQGSTSSGRSKRKRTTAETDDSPLVVDSTPAQADENSSKRRKIRVSSRALSQTASQTASLAPSQNTDQFDEDIAEGTPKRKRSTTSSDPATASGTSQQGEEEVTGKKRKGGAIKSSQAQKKVKSEFADLDVDESTLEPGRIEDLRKQKVALEKSRKLSESMKNRWAMGGMKKAQETRLANNALKKAAKEAEASRPPIQPTPTTSLAPFATPVPLPVALTPSIAPKEIAPAPKKSTILKLPLTGAPKISATKAPVIKAPPSKVPVLKTTAPKATASKKPAAKRSKAAPPPPRAASTRAKKPNKSFGGFDGANDSDDGEESDTQFASEYDTFLALTSPGTQVTLGKRIPKRKTESSAYVDDDEEDDFQSAEQTEGDDYSFES